MNIKIMEIINQIPIVNLVPMLIKILQEFPSLWDNVPEEKKQELFNALVAASARAASNYAKNG